MKFEDLKLSPGILNGLKDTNHTELTELQKEVLPKILDGHDALIKAPVGKDKNCSFVVPALAKIDSQDDIEDTRALILTPNSDEAHNIEELTRGMGYHAQINCASVDLDGSEEQQKEALKSQAEVVIGNPGPLLDIMQNLRFVFRQVEYVVIDDINKLASLNLLSKVKKILKRVLSEHQLLIYTDELTDEIADFTTDYLEDGITIGFKDGPGARLLSKPPKITDQLSHGYIYVPNRMKITTLMAHIDESPEDRYVIFTASKRGTDRLYKTLRKRNYKATSLHGKLSDEKQAQRFANFTNGDIQFLLVADISAGTLDIQNVKQVINYDVPNEVGEYRYRANLVGPGKAASLVSLVSKQDRSDINKLESELGQAPKELDLPQEVQQKLKERKKKKKNSQPKKRRNGNKKKKRQKKKDDGMELPRPSYDKLSGGKKGKHKKDNKSGVIDMLKSLFN